MFDDDEVKSGQALAGGPCPTGQLGDGVTCTVNPCFLKNGGCDALTTCAADAATGDAICGRCPAGYERSGGQLTACENIDGCAKEPCYALVLCTDMAGPGGHCLPHHRAPFVPRDEGSKCVR